MYMKIHRFYIKENLERPLGEEMLIKKELYTDIIHQFNNVLKFKVNEKIIFFNGEYIFDYLFEIKEINKNYIKLELLEKKVSYKQDLETTTEGNFRQKLRLFLCFSVIKKIISILSLKKQVN